MKKIYIVDDDQSFLDILKDYFGEQSLEVITNNSGDNILSELLRYEPDAVLLDVSMPQNNGFDILRVIRNHALLSNIPIIMVTGESDSNSQIEGLTSGADDYVLKPFDLNVLYARILNLFERTLVKTRTKFDQINLINQMIRIYSKRNYKVYSKLLESFENCPVNWKGFVPDLIIRKKEKIRVFQFESAQSILEENFLKRLEELSNLTFLNDKLEINLVLRSKDTLYQCQRIVREYGYKIKFKLMNKKIKRTEYAT